MRAAIYEKFEGPIIVKDVPDPEAPAGGVVLAVRACGICRSDWHGWMGNDPDIVLPHVPGHELAGEVVGVGKNVKNWKTGDRVTVPFVGGCGDCVQCESGNQQICDFQFQPGFTAWGAFAEFVAIDYADENLVALPPDIDFVTASSLGCRFITSFRAVAHQARIAKDEWIAVYGCGGVGLSAIMIAAALGAKPIAVDIEDEKLEFAKSIGAARTVNSKTENSIDVIREITGGGANVTVDALGNSDVVGLALASLSKRGRHVQVGLVEADDDATKMPVNLIISRELEIVGSHGMQAFKYPEMLRLIAEGKLAPEKLIGGTVSLQESVTKLTSMNEFRGTGVTVINEF